MFGHAHALRTIYIHEFKIKFREGVQEEEQASAHKSIKKFIKDGIFLGHFSTIYMLH